MKKMSRKSKLRHIRRCKRMLKRKHKEMCRIASRVHRLPVGYVRIKAPALFSLEPSARSELLSFIEKLRNTIVKNNTPTQIDFTITRKMVAGGTLLFSAELRRCLLLTHKKVKVCCTPPRDSKAQQVLKQIGIFDLIGYKKIVNPRFNDVIHWRQASGNMVEGSKYENIMGTYDGVMADTLMSKLFTGITEAMTNCHHHAYIAIRNDGLGVMNEERMWWMFSQENNGSISVAFCDLGVGIPTTVPIKKPRLWDLIFSLGKSTSDAAIIEQSIEDSISRTKKKYRGKGLKQLLSAIQDSPSGQIKIFSNRGCYTYANGKATIRDYPDSIMGTLIQWKLPIIQGSLFHESR